MGGYLDIPGLCTGVHSGSPAVGSQPRMPSTMGHDTGIQPILHCTGTVVGGTAYSDTSDTVLHRGCHMDSTGYHWYR